MHARSGAMPHQIWDHTIALSTAPIFDDTVYLSEALGLAINQNEDDLDAELALLARESGIHDPYQFVSPPKTISRAISSMTLDSDHRSSRSIHSQETQSTSFTSAPSRTSRDHLCSSERPLSKRVPPKLVHSPQSVENYAQAIERPASGIRSRQSSTLSITPSVISTSSSSQQAQPRRKRGSAIFSMFRRESSSCTSTSHHGHHTRPRGVKLECGHALSAYDIRKHIQDALQIGPQKVPNCCGRALPRSALESVLTKEETDLILESAAQSSETSSFRDSGYSEAGLPSIDSLPSSHSNALSDKLPTLPARQNRHKAISIDSALAEEAFKSFRTQQKEQFERVSTFECNQRKALSAHYQCTMKWLKSQHEANRTERMKQHTDNLERLEERQLLAEHDLLKAQSQETQNVATALKYIEAYCLGTRNPQEHSHAVSEEDFKKLDRQRSTQKDLPRKHASAINVLRARQELDTARKLEMHKAELEQLDAEYEKEKTTKETEYRKELEKLEAVIQARRKRLLQRWDLKFEMWRRDWEEQHSTTLHAKLEHEEWPARKADHAITIPDSSSLAQYIKAAA